MIDGMMAGVGGGDRDETGRAEVADPQNGPVQAGDGWLVDALSAEGFLPDTSSDRQPTTDGATDGEPEEGEPTEPRGGVASGDDPGDGTARDGTARDTTARDGAAGEDAPAGPGHTAGSSARADPPPAVPRRGSDELREEVIVRARARGGLRGVLHKITGGRLEAAASRAERHRGERVQRIRRPLHGAHHIAVGSVKGGVGTTTVAACLGLVLAQCRGDGVLALDAHPKAGTLADRLVGEPTGTVRDLLGVLDTLESVAEVARYTGLVRGLQVLASEQDPAASTVFDRDEYRRVCAVLARFHDLVITDTGPGLVHSAMEGAMADADGLVVVGAPAADGASGVDRTLDWLVAQGDAERVADAVVVLSCARSDKHVDGDEARRRFAGRVRAVVEVPFDPHLATGDRIDVDQLRAATYDAFLTLAAQLAERFRPPAVPVMPASSRSGR